MDSGLIVSIVAVVIAMLGLILNSRKETKQDAAALAEIKAGMNTVNNGVTEIRVDLRSMREDLTNHSERLARVEARAENNTRRLDTLEGKKHD